MVSMILMRSESPMFISIVDHNGDENNNKASTPGIYTHFIEQGL